MFDEFPSELAIATAPQKIGERTYTVDPGLRRSTTRTFSERKPTRIQKRRQRNRTYLDDPFRARFGKALPRGMREEARGLAWKEFRARYSPDAIRVERMRAERLAAGRHDFRFALSGLRADGEGTRARIVSMGACSAITQVLADHGYRVEILEFHQYEIFEATVTFIYTVHKTKRAWAMGFGASRDQSIANAVCSAATRLHT